MQTLFKNIKITGISAALPANQLEIELLKEKFGELEVQRIMASTGIQAVNVATQTQKTTDLCFAATQSLLGKLEISPETIDGIILVTQTPDAKMPASSVILQHKLRLPIHTVAFDINYGCSGYIYGLFQAALLISSGNCQRVLVCVGDTISQFLDPNDHASRLIFGDAAAATLVEHGDHQAAFNLFTDGSGAKSLHIGLDNIANKRPYLHMDGQAIMEFALKRVPECIGQLLDFTGWKKDQLGSVILHQANQFMLSYLRRKMQLNIDAVPIAVKNTGNTGPASIPLTLSLVGNSLNKENRLNQSVLCGFGVGLSWGAIALDLSQTKFIPPIKV
ncbi:MAG: 3-oxoacyl-[acyl-carrier-protein] synthase, partial [Gammaproteobacteria bacterium]|nr:3-oxoacyl-[acyl-carrier-protein] synthase [Gammaproteobacteria bacterium]